MTSYNDLAPQSKVWIYQADRFLEEEEITILDTATSDFVKEWAAHGSNLKAYGRIYHERFLVLIVDETEAGASGCSIDSSVHFVKDIGKVLDIDFFKRTEMVYVQEEGRMDTFDLSKIQKEWGEGTINTDTRVFNNLVKTKEELETQWLLPIKETWMANRLK